MRFKPTREGSLFLALLYVYLMAASVYAVWRFTIVNWHVWLGPATYAAELIGIVTTVMFLVVTRRVLVPEPRANMRSRTVDALIPTYNEPLTVVEPTITGALNVRGVRDVYVLDDGNRDDVKQLAASLGARYVARVENTHAKAGNMNNGLRHTDAEFLLALDADHVPHASFLEKTLGYFDDDHVAFVQTPQTFTNNESFLFRPTRKRLWNENSTFYEVIQPGKNRSNSAFYVGTGAVLRRAAIDDVGGFATTTATEDIHTSVRLHARGWRSIFLPEPLACGLNPVSLKEYFRQRRRWAAGSMGLLFRSSDSPLATRGLTPAQRFNYVSATTSHLQGIHKLFFFLLPIMCIFTLQSPVRSDLLTVMPAIVGFFLLSFAIIAVYARGTLHILYTEAYKLSLFPAQIAGLRGLLRPKSKLAPARKNANPAEASWLKAVYWGLLLLAVIACVRSFPLLHGDGDATLIGVSLVILFVNTVELLSFVGYLELYELRHRRLSRRPRAESPAT